MSLGAGRTAGVRVQQLHTVERGRGATALLLLHGFGSSSSVWAGVSAELERDYRCVMPDLRGHGMSADLALQHNCISDFADDITHLIGALGLDSFVLVGHSMGGKIAMAVAARRPQGLTALALLAPSPPNPEPITRAQRAHLLQHQRSRAAAEHAAHALTGWPLPSTLFRQVVDDRLRCSPRAWRWWLESGSKEDVSQSLARIDIPVRVLSGLLDITIPTAVIESEVMSRLPSAQLARIVECGHLIPLEAPEALVRCIRLLTGHLCQGQPELGGVRAAGV